MSKFKSVRKGGKKAPQQSNYKGMISCISLIVIGFLLVFLLFYAMLKSSSGG